MGFLNDCEPLQSRKILSERDATAAALHLGGWQGADQGLDLGSPGSPCPPIPGEPRHACGCSQEAWLHAVNGFGSGARTISPNFQKVYYSEGFD
jgi:hypothetical protein